MIDELLIIDCMGELIQNRFFEQLIKGFYAMFEFHAIQGHFAVEPMISGGK